MQAPRLIAEAADNAYSDSASAWKGLVNIGALELDGRDGDLASQLKDLLDPNAVDLNSALDSASLGTFLQCLFRVIQPFMLMFRDVLRFFEKAGARDGRVQWRILVDEEIIDLQHFEDILQHWHDIDCLLEIPALNHARAFLPYELLCKVDPDHPLATRQLPIPSIQTGIAEVDAWLTEYHRGRYLPLPEILYSSKSNNRFGLADTASIAIAALHTINSRGLDRNGLHQYLRQSRPYSETDALNISSIAQNETDRWLAHYVLVLSPLYSSDLKRESFDRELANAFRRFPKRRMMATVRLTDVKRLLSLPAWKTRHETYGVWVATRVLDALEDHQVTINHESGELRFAFAEARIADVASARPPVGLFSERRTSLDAPVGRGRVASVQPDYGVWTVGSQPETCVLVIEAKHYRRRSRRNFRDALIDYARAHPKANVVLVNYGPVGSPFADLPWDVRNRCMMIEHFHPENSSACERFHQQVRICVGEPEVQVPNLVPVRSADLVAVDVSLSMSEILHSKWFRNFVTSLPNSSSRIALVDSQIRLTIDSGEFADWLSKNRLGPSTELGRPISGLVTRYGTVAVVTDQEGVESLRQLSARMRIYDVEDDLGTSVVIVDRPNTEIAPSACHGGVAPRNMS